MRGFKQVYLAPVARASLGRSTFLRPLGEEIVRLAETRILIKEAPRCVAVSDP